MFVLITFSVPSGVCPCRLSRYQQFKDFQRRILVATNLFGRGMDIERVNIVFNYDMPEDSDTYLHRVSVLRNGFVYGAVCFFFFCRRVCQRHSTCVSARQVARAGRFGTKGLAITFVSDETDAKTLNDVQDRFEVNVAELPDEIDISSYSRSSRKQIPVDNTEVPPRVWCADGSSRRALQRSLTCCHTVRFIHIHIRFIAK